MFKGEGNNEVVITRHGQFTLTINIVNFYGPQESRTNFNVIHENSDVIFNQILNIHSKGEHLLFIVDMERKVGSLVTGRVDDIVTKAVLDLINTANL